jgi:hypothetical protein
MGCTAGHFEQQCLTAYGLFAGRRMVFKLFVQIADG